LGRVKFVTAKAEFTAKQSQPAFDWSDLESHLRELVKLSSEPLRFAIESRLTSAHEPHDTLVPFEQVDVREELTSDRQSTADEQTDLPAPPRSYEQLQHRHESGRDPLEMLSLLAAISSTPS
jgi:hypothetical protein